LSRNSETIKALNEWEKRKFNYGDADCCQFVAHVIKHLSGKDYSKAFEYRSEKEADNLISRFGGLKELITDILGEPSESLQDGDPVVNNFPIIGETMGIKLGKFVVCLTEKGIAKLHNRHQICGWSICLKR
tara:strand:- start:3667 stop:4059 length:393 start_codon:yes stop_codon:yes gene_type:complete